MKCDWLANRGCLFLGKYSIEIDVLGLGERRDQMSIPKTKESEKKYIQELSLQQKPHSTKN